MNVVCPRCRDPISADDVNELEAVALCRNCIDLFRLEDLDDSPPDEASPRDLPIAESCAGCALLRDGPAVVLRATTRAGIACFIVPLALFWCIGLTLLTLTLLGVFGQPSPAPQPATPASGAGPGTPASSFDFFMVVMMSVFGGAGLALAFGAAFYTIGRVEVRVNGERSAVRVTVGPLRWTRPFNAADVREVRRRRESSDRGPIEHIYIRTGSGGLKFAATLSPKRRTWMLKALRAALHTSKTK